MDDRRGATWHRRELDQLPASALSSSHDIPLTLLGLRTSPGRCCRMASREGYIQIVRSLLAHGADPTVLAGEGRDAAQVAATAEIKALLMEVRGAGGGCRCGEGSRGR